MPEKNANIGRYVVTAELGRGAMGIVHKAHDPVMGRDVAIKTVLLPHGIPRDKREEFHRRFLREAQAAGRLSHPGIVTVYEFEEGPTDELPFIAMEYVQGPTLHELICKEGALNPEWALSITDTLADALQLAHGQGIIHRDVKPANILVRESDGAAKIADFGVACINVSDLTQAGTAYGSPSYMAPERIQGLPADARSDLFSLAVILYEALCGARPFGGDDFASTCYAVLYEEPAPVGRHAADLTPALDPFFQRALAKDPDERFQDAAGFREALEVVRREQQFLQSDGRTVQIAVSTEHPGVPPAESVSAEPQVEAETVPQAPSESGTQAETSRHPATEVEAVRRFSARSIGIGAAAVLLLLIGLVSVWGLRDGTASDGTIPAVPAAAAISPDPVPDLVIQPATSPLAPEGFSADPPPPAVSESEGGSPPDVFGRSATPPEPANEATPSDTAGSSTKPASPSVSRPKPPKKRERAVPTPGAGSSAGALPEPPSPDAAPPTASETVAPSDTVVEPTEPAVLVAAAPEPGYLDLTVRSSIKAGTLTLHVDGEEVYSADLATESSRWSRMYKKALRQVREEFEARVEIPPGRHTVTAKVESLARSRSYESQVDVEIEPGQARGLRIVAGRTLGRRLTLTLD